MIHLSSSKFSPGHWSGTLIRADTCLLGWLATSLTHSHTHTGTCASTHTWQNTHFASKVRPFFESKGILAYPQTFKDLVLGLGLELVLGQRWVRVRGLMGMVRGWWIFYAYESPHKGRNTRMCVLGMEQVQEQTQWPAINALMHKYRFLLWPSLAQKGVFLL